MLDRLVDPEQMRSAIPIVIGLLVLSYLLIRRFLMFFLSNLRAVRQAKKVAQLRQYSGKDPKTIITRKTDLMDRLSPQQKKVHAYAEALLQQGQVLQAAKMFQSIQFQRRAIDILEKSGHIDEAASILVDMDLPNRAAILFERNGKLEQAAEQYLQAKQVEAAARLYMRLGRNNFEFYKKAGELFYQVGLIDACLFCYSRVLMSDEILKICLVAKKYSFLIDYMRMSAHVAHIVPQLKIKEFETLLGEFELTPMHTELLAFWIARRQDAEFVSRIFSFLAASKACCEFFWAGVSERLGDELLDMVSSSLEIFSQDALEVHYDALVETSRQKLTHKMSKLVRSEKIEDLALSKSS